MLRKLSSLVMAAALAAPLAWSADDLHARARKGKKPKEADAKAEAGPQAPAGPRKEDPAFDEAVKDHEKIEGLFTLYHKDGRYLLALRPDQLDRDYMVSLTRETGIGQSFLLAAQVLGDGPVRFQKVGKRVQLLMKNARFAAQDDPDIRRAVSKSFSDSLLGSAKLESQPHPDSRAILVDLGSFVLTDIEGAGAALAQFLQAPYQLDRDNSSIASAKSLPVNLELNARLHFVSSKPANFVNLVDPRSLFLDYRYSITEIPAAPGFIPRIADDRVGHFLAMFQDFSDDRRETPYVRYVTRWSLQKEEPYAAMSKPKEPITFWLENNIPKPYRKAVADGILVWNQAFEKIGFKDAVVVKQQPDDADWDPADARYSTVRWFITTDSSFAIGPSRINPWTGQIYDADIGVSESIVRGARREFEEIVDPVGAIREMFDGLTSSRGGVSACTMARGAIQQAAFGSHVLAARGMEPGSPQEEKYVNDFITHVMAHEVGHTLGLRHNFRASEVLAFSDLHNEGRTVASGLTGSVMDYIPVNLAPGGVTQGQHWQTTLGPYDHWAIEYAYKVIPGVKSSKEELPELRAIASRVAERGNLYGTDEDLSEPRTCMWDIGGDEIAYYDSRVKIARELWRKIPTAMARPGEGYQAMRRAFQTGLFEFTPVAVNVTKYIGGMYANRDHVGDPQGRLPLEPVAAERQREALRFLRTNLFDGGAFELPADLLNKLAPSRWWDFTGSIFFMPRMEYPLHDVVLALQTGVLAQLHGSVKLDRLVDLEGHYPAGQKPFTLAEMFDGLRESIWTELYAPGAPRVSAFRRALQREHLRHLVSLVVRPAPGVPEDAGTMARYTLNDLKGRIDAALRSAGADAGTRAHLDETRARIEAALSAGMVRPAS